MAADLNALESAVLEMLLRGNDVVLEALRLQLDEGRVASRWYSGAGFFTHFWVPESAPRVPAKQSFAFGDVLAEIDGLENGAGFLLFVKGGVLDFLEGYSYGEEIWPTDIANFKLQYWTGGERDLAALAREWSA